MAESPTGSASGRSCAAGPMGHEDETRRIAPPRPLSSGADACPDAAAGSGGTWTSGPVARSVPGREAFRPGEVVGGRYLVVRFVARGGMGEVYEVDDLELRERVALKTVRSEVVL